MLCADELDKMTDDDRGALHEAMEQQTITVAKAGIHATLNARAGLLGAANPKWGRFDPHTVLAEQIELPPALLSRFDLILTLQDVVDREADALMAGHILAAHRDAGLAAAGGGPGRAPPIGAEELRRYIAYAKRAVAPVLSPEAADALRTAYVDLRASGADTGDVTVTARQLEGFIRLSEARARAELSPVITPDHARYVVDLFYALLRRLAGEVSATGQQLRVTSIDAVVTGYTASQREVMRSTADVLRKAADGLTAAELEEALRARGIVPERIGPTIDRMRERGDVSLGRDNRYRYVSS
jgi:replicative DNA helicase Mcm